MKKNKKIFIVLSIVVVILILAIIILLVFKKDKNNNVYKFDFSTDTVPTSSYKGTINLDNGKVSFESIEGCAVLPEGTSCGDPKKYEGEIDKDVLDKVKDFLKKYDNKDSSWLMMALQEILDGNKDEGMDTLDFLLSDQDTINIFDTDTK